MRIDARQVRKIHTLKGALKLTDAEYREFLMERGDGFASSCKDLTHDEADRLIRELEEEALTRGVWEKRAHSGKTAYEHLGRRPGMASPAQLRMLAVMWKSVSYVRAAKEREQALDSFVARICGCERLIWLPAGDVQKVVRAMEAMKKKGGGR